MVSLSFATQPLEYLGQKAARLLEGGTIASLAVKGASGELANGVIGKFGLTGTPALVVDQAGHLADQTGNLVRYAVGQGFDAFQRSGQTVLSESQLETVKSIAQDIPTRIKAAAHAFSGLDGPTINTFIQGEVARGQDMAEAIKAGNWVQSLPEVSIPNLHLKDGLTGIRQGLSNFSPPAIPKVSIPNLHIQEGLLNVQGFIDGIHIPDLHLKDGLAGIRDGVSNFAPPPIPESLQSTVQNISNLSANLTDMLHHPVTHQAAHHGSTIWDTVNSIVS